MTYLAMSAFLDVAAKVGNPRRTKIKHIKNADPYTPAIDFYKPLREGIQSIHRKGKAKSALGALLFGVSDPKKKTNYPACINGYATWWSNNTLVWFEPPKGKYAKLGFEVAINPELGLIVGGQRHVIKLYMNVNKLTQSRADMIGALMTQVLGPQVAANTTMSTLDMRRATLFSAIGNSTKMLAAIDAVLSDIAAIWPTV